MAPATSSSGITILYIGSNRAEVDAVGVTLRDLGEPAELSWASTIDQAAVLLERMPCVEMLLVETPVDRSRWRPFLTRVRSRPSPPLVVVVTAEGTGPLFESFDLGADEILTGPESLRELLARRPAARRVAGLEDGLEHEPAARGDLERQLADAVAALQEAEARHRTAIAATEKRLASQHAQYEIAMARAAATWEMVDEQLRAAAVEVERSRRDQESAAAEVERLSRTQSELTSRAAEAAEARRDLERRLADAETALADARRAADERRAAGARAAERRRDLEAALRSARDELDARTADVERLERRAEALTAAIAAAEERRTALEHRLEATEAAFQDATERATRERIAAAKRAAEREAELGEQIQQERRDRARFEQESAAATAALATLQAGCRTLEARLVEETEALRSRGVEQAARFESQLADERFAFDMRLVETQDRNRELTLERDALGASLCATEDQLRRLEREHREACDRFERERTAAAADIGRLTAQREAAERALEEECAGFQNALGRLSRDRAAAAQASEAARAELQGQLQDLHAALEAAKGREATLEAEAGRASELGLQLEESRAEARRLFDHLPLPMFRCTRDGAMTEANRAWTVLVRRKSSELCGPDFASAVFESPKDLSWLVDRCPNAATTESIETTVCRGDGARLFVRLSACAPTPDIVEVAVEDLTRVRVLQERLGRAHRMEAVGRLASEVALTGTRLINDVHQDVRQWIQEAAAGSVSSPQGEWLLESLARAAASLQPLVACGDKQADAPPGTDLVALMHDLAPVLKRVAGDDVEICVAEMPVPVILDVETERVERLLVNLSSYGRGRMPFGGRLTIEVATTDVDRQFTARYPNVRPGRHALITVRETRRAEPSELARRNRQPADPSDVGAIRRPAVDLRALQGLVGECGGHLWLKVQPPGEMVAKIRLPLWASYDQADAVPVAARSRPGNAITRWFQR